MSGGSALYVCKHCDLQFNSLSLVRAHLEARHRDKVSSDDDIIASVTYLPLPDAAAATEPANSSDEEPTAAAHRPKLQAQKGVSSVRCKICGLSFIETKLYLRHCKSCRATKPKKSPVTSKEVKKKKHEKKAKKSGKRSASDSAGGKPPRGYKSSSKYYDSLDRSGGRSPLPFCELCNLYFTMQSTYQIHLDSKEHRAVERAAAARLVNVTYQCDLCVLQFDHKKQLKKHMVTRDHRRKKKLESIFARIMEEKPYEELLVELNELSPTDSESVSCSSSDIPPARGKAEIRQFVDELLRPAKQFTLPPRTYHTYFNDVPGSARKTPHPMAVDNARGFTHRDVLPCGYAPGTDFSLIEALNFMEQSIQHCNSGWTPPTKLL